jgi:CheY-like chemotaxis protein
MNNDSETIHGKRILLVDDKRVERELLKDLLRLDEHIVVEANNGAEAYSLFTQSQFDLVMTDRVMPFMSGDELAQRIRQLAPQQPILMVTGENYRRGPKNPFNAVLNKPFDYAVLQEEIKKLL